MALWLTFMLLLKDTVWWLGSKADIKEYISTCESCKKGNKQPGKKFGLLQESQKPSKQWGIINIDFVTGLPTAGHLNYNSVFVVVCRLTKKFKFIPVHKDLDLKGVAFAWWSYMLTEAGLPLAIIRARDPNLQLNSGNS